VQSFFKTRMNVSGPFLSDAHAHIIGNGYMNQLPLMGSQSIQGASHSLNLKYPPSVHLEVIDRVKSYLVSHPDVNNDTTRWIEGMGWDQTKWLGEGFPTAVRVITLDLDR